MLVQFVRKPPRPGQHTPVPALSTGEVCPIHQVSIDAKREHRWCGCIVRQLEEEDSPYLPNNLSAVHQRGCEPTSMSNSSVHQKLYARSKDRTKICQRKGTAASQTDMSSLRDPFTRAPRKQTCSKAYRSASNLNQVSSSNGNVVPASQQTVLTGPSLFLKQKKSGQDGISHPNPTRRFSSEQDDQEA